MDSRQLALWHPPDAIVAITKMAQLLVRNIAADTAVSFENARRDYSGCDPDDLLAEGIALSARAAELAAADR